MDVVAGVVIALLGLAVGGMLTTVVDRVPDRSSLLRPGPRCVTCGAPIAGRDRVPVVSWLLLRGRCRDCGAAIPWQYPVIEAATPLLFLATFAVMGFSWALPAYLYLAALAVAATAIDIAHHRLPDAIVLPSYPIVLGLLVVALLGPGSAGDLGRALLGGAAMFAGFFLLALINPSGMGGGDIKLAGVLGMLLGWVGWWAVLVGALGSFFIGAIASVGLMAAGRVGRKGHIPFGPFMFIGTYIGLLYGQQLGRWYLG